MTLYAILADIHGNYTALKTVVKDARQMAKKNNTALQFICLGDVVDYGPQPDKCMDWVLKNVNILIQGNHDRVVAAPDYEPPYDINLNYHPITQWTRRTLKSDYRAILGQWQPRLVPPQSPLPDFVLFHSSLVRKDARVDYLGAAQENMEWLQKNSIRYGLFGHTHFQGFFTRETTLDMKSRVTAYLTCPPGARVCQEGQKFNRLNDTWQVMCLGNEDDWEQFSPSWSSVIFNPGSVGQPRQHEILTMGGGAEDYRAAYMLLRFNQAQNLWEFQFRRVDYAVEETERHLNEYVHWPKTEKDPLMGHNSYQPPAGRLADRLRDLVEKTLIPTLKKGYCSEKSLVNLQE